MGRLAHLYPEYHPKQDAPVAARDSSSRPPPGRSSRPHPRPQSPPTTASYSQLPFLQHPGKVRRETETSTAGDSVPDDSQWKGKSPSPSRSHLLLLTLPLRSSRQADGFPLCILPSLGAGEIKNKGCISEGTVYASVLFQRVHLFPLVYR